MFFNPSPGLNFEFVSQTWFTFSKHEDQSSSNMTNNIIQAEEDIQESLNIISRLF